ncbi:common central domain of tyrosinase-domain-containing protein [Geopyxis carbonaria]|nr:common central domain of tyrosinase-domain-containing protein [Geopyxis carbonaria]
MKLPALTTLLALTSTVTALVSRQLQTSNNLTAVTGITTSLHPRQELTTLATSNADVFNMFLLALQSLQATPEELDESFYAVCGIHGIPYVPWQGQGNANTPAGYCTHRSVLFVTWHRPYLILLEQLLHQHAKRIAARFPAASRARWQTAAEQVRLPYWDWAATATAGIPAALSARNAAVTTPTGAATIPNPLASYTFQRADFRAAYFYAPYNTQRVTGRSSSADATLRNAAPARREQTYNAFTIRSFSRFSSSAFSSADTPASVRSLESIHDVIHGSVGGHMSQVPLAAFDPLFWLHHCNVDRLGAMWQAITPASTVNTQSGITAQAARSRTMGYPAGTIENADTPLWPFRTPAARLLTSRPFSSAKGIFTYGYSYPEVPADLRNASDDSLAAYTRARIDELYGPTVRRPANSRLAAGAPVSRTEWSASVIFDAGELPETFTVWVFLGATTPPTSATDPTLVSGVTSFSMTGGASAGGSNIIAGAVPLTGALEAANVGLAASEALPFLRQRLTWAVINNADGAVLPTGSLKSLEVSVASNEVAHFAQKERMAEGGSWTVYREVTKGKAGGLEGESRYLKNVKTVSA